jgi:hypothetical protein
MLTLADRGSVRGRRGHAMETTTEFTVLEQDRRAAVEVVAAALRTAGHHVHVGADRVTATCGSRFLTALLGALVHPAREYRRYELDVASRAGRTVLTLRHAAHGTAVAGGAIGIARKRESWRRTSGVVEGSLQDAGLLRGRTDRVDTSGIPLGGR